MRAIASIRDLRNHFPKVRKLLEKDGEVVLTERGQPRYRLTAYTEGPAKAPPAVDYWARLQAYQPRPISAAEAQALHDANRGDR